MEKEISAFLGAETEWHPELPTGKETAIHRRFGDEDVDNTDLALDIRGTGDLK